MNTPRRKLILKACLVLSLTLNLTATSLANVRILEYEFRLSQQVNSEFSARFPVFSAGRLTVEALCPNPAARPSRLRLVLVRPDKSEVNAEGTSPLKVEHSVTLQEVNGLANRRATEWVAKIINLENNDGAPPVAGTLKITVPTSTRVLEDTQFTLQGFRNAQSIPFKVQSPGRLVIEVSWQADSRDSKEPPPLTVSLIHESQNKIYANKTGTRSLRIEHQVSDQDLDRGSNWSVKILNNSLTGVRGRVTISYTPSL